MSAIVPNPQQFQELAAAPVLIGEEVEQDWDVIALVEYPSRKAFLEMAMSKQMNDIHHHREAGLERTVLLACGGGRVPGERREWCGIARIEEETSNG